MRKYEYKTLVCQGKDDPSEKLNSIGAEGWELVCMAPETPDFFPIFVFKREIPQTLTVTVGKDDFRDIPTSKQIEAANAARPPKPTPALIPLYIMHHTPATLVVRDNKNPVDEYTWGFSFTKADTGEEKEVTLYGAQKWLDRVHPGKFYISLGAAYN